MSERTLYVVDGLGPLGQETVLTGVVQKDGDIIEADEALRARIEKPVMHLDAGELTEHQARVVREHKLTAARIQELGVEGLKALNNVGVPTAKAIVDAVTGGPAIVIPWLRHPTDEELAARQSDDTDQQDEPIDEE